MARDIIAAPGTNIFSTKLCSGGAAKGNLLRNVSPLCDGLYHEMNSCKSRLDCDGVLDYRHTRLIRGEKGKWLLGVSLREEGGP